MAKIKARHILLDSATLEVNPTTGELQQVPGTDGSGGGGGSGTAGEVTKVEYFVTTGVGVVGGNKYVTLSEAPVNPETVRVTLVGGSAQLNALITPGTDFTVVGDQLSWDGLDMEDALTASGITFIVEYSINIAVPDQAINVQVDATGFSGALSPLDTDVQSAFNTLDVHTHAASTISVPTFLGTGIFSSPANVAEALQTVHTHTHSTDNINTVGTFSGNLAGSDTVSEALTIIDSSTFGNSISVTQVNTFSAGKVIRHNGTDWVLAQANTVAGATSCWLVLSATGAAFTAQQIGRCSLPAHGFTTGDILYLDPNTAGLLTSTRPVGTTTLPLGFYLPFALVEGTDNLQILGRYPKYTPVLAEYKHTSGSASDTITFSNLDVNSYGGKINFEAAMSTSVAGVNGKVDVTINGSSANYNSTSNYDNGATWSRDATTSAANMTISMDNSFSISDTVFIEGVIARSAHTTGSERVRLMARFINQDGFGGINNSIQTANITNITSVTFFDAGAGTGYRFLPPPSGDYVRLLWTPPGL